MAHSCPECGQTCYCGGDIDDICFENTKEERNCRHWKECANDDPDDNYPVEDDEAGERE